MFCGWSWRIVSLYVPVVMIGWYGVESAIFGSFVAGLIGLGECGERLLMAAAAAGFAVSAYIGFRALRTVSFILVPTITPLLYTHLEKRLLA